VRLRLKDSSAVRIRFDAMAIFNRDESIDGRENHVLDDGIGRYFRTGCRRYPVIMSSVVRTRPNRERIAMRRSPRGSTLDVVEDDHVRGTGGALTTVLVYGDYECPHTRALELALTRVRRLEPNAFRSVFRHFPLRDIHPHAERAAEAAEAVYSVVGSDAFWVMHDGLFAHQDQLDRAGLEQRGAEAGIDPAALRAAVEAGRFAERVQRDVETGAANGVDRTPSVFINGERYLGPRDVATLRRVLTAAR
jgi:protein-disulfide isomerase